MLHTLYQVFEPRGLERKISIFTCVFLCFIPRTPWGGSILEPGALFEQTRLRITRQYYIPSLKQLSLAVLEKMFKNILLENQGSHGIRLF